MFRILSLDGGGIRGAFIAACLAEFEKKIDGSLTDYFDLIAGTSTGGIIATLMACGVPMSEIKNIYANRVHEVFTPMDPYFEGIYKPIAWATSPFLQFFTGSSSDEMIQAKYTAAGLDKITSHLIGDITIGEVMSTRLLVTAVDLINGRPVTFKTQHLPFHFRDQHRSCKDIIRATSAAPTYFNPAEIEPGSAFCDGGLWANNPANVALSEAVYISTTCQRPEDIPFGIDEIEVLSLGTGFSHYSHVPPEQGSGFKWWSKRTMEIMFDAQSQSTCFLLNRMLDKRFYRIDFELPNIGWAHLDSFNHVDEVIEFGAEEGRKHQQAVMRQFLTEKKVPYTPYLIDEG